MIKTILAAVLVLFVTVNADTCAETKDEITAANTVSLSMAFTGSAVGAALAAPPIAPVILFGMYFIVYFKCGAMLHHNCTVAELGSLPKISKR